MAQDEMGWLLGKEVRGCKIRSEKLGNEQMSRAGPQVVLVH